MCRLAQKTEQKEMDSPGGRKDVIVGQDFTLKRHPKQLDQANALTFTKCFPGYTHCEMTEVLQVLFMFQILISFTRITRAQIQEVVCLPDRDRSWWLPQRRTQISVSTRKKQSNPTFFSELLSLALLQEIVLCGLNGLGELGMSRGCGECRDPEWMKVNCGRVQYVWLPVMHHHLLQVHKTTLLQTAGQTLPDNTPGLQSSDQRQIQGPKRPGALPKGRTYEAKNLSDRLAVVFQEWQIWVAQIFVWWKTNSNTTFLYESFQEKSLQVFNKQSTTLICLSLWLRNELSPWGYFQDFLLLIMINFSRTCWKSLETKGTSKISSKFKKIITKNIKTFCN